MIEPWHYFLLAGAFVSLLGVATSLGMWIANRASRERMQLMSEISEVKERLASVEAHIKNLVGWSKARDAARND